MLTNMEHVEVLREMRADHDSAGIPEYAAALDAAIASLSAPQSGDWVLVPREPTQGMLDAGFIADRDADTHKGHARWAAMLASAPQPPAEAQVQGGGEVVWPMTEAEVRQWISACNHEPARQVLRDYLQFRTAPPSAPVGMERKYPDDGNGDDDAYNRGWNDCLDALARQPAAVDGVVALRESVLRYCVRELNGARQGDNPECRAELVHAALTAAQQGGSDNDR